MQFPGHRPVPADASSHSQQFSMYALKLTETNLRRLSESLRTRVSDMPGTGRLVETWTVELSSGSVRFADLTAVLRMTNDGRSRRVESLSLCMEWVRVDGSASR